MKDRITLLIKAKNLTAAQFADEIGVQKSSISHILSGRNNASLDFIQKILLCYPDVSIDWLMFGKGPIFKSIVTAVSGNIDGSLNAVSPGSLPHVDLFSDLTPAGSPDFHKENELSQEVKTDENIKPEDDGIADSIPAKENKEKVLEYLNRKPGTDLVNSGHKNNSTKSIVKIVEFYSDNTYKEYFPE
jgi:transcriptional regulator with XRE-family HTH domain